MQNIEQQEVRDFMSQRLSKGGDTKVSYKKEKKSSTFIDSRVLNVRCPLLAKNIKRHKLQLKCTSIIKTALLNYIYLGMVDFSNLSMEDIFQLIHISHKYNLKHLSYICTEPLATYLNIETIFPCTKLAFDLNIESLKSVCLTFIYQHYQDFIANPNGIKILGVTIFREVVRCSGKVLPIEEIECTLIQDYHQIDFHKEILTL